jgi:undecaprenyl-diphosphatase
MTPLGRAEGGPGAVPGDDPGHQPQRATIIGGMLLGLSRQAATDFSFFLAIPTLIGAGVYSLYKERALLSMADLPMFAVGLLFSFISAWLCVRWLLRYISSHSFVPFAWYRIAFGIVVLATAWPSRVLAARASRRTAVAMGPSMAGWWRPARCHRAGPHSRTPAPPRR